MNRDSIDAVLEHWECWDSEWEDGDDQYARTLAAFTLADAAFTFNGHKVDDYRPAMGLTPNDNGESLINHFDSESELELVLAIHDALLNGDITIADIDNVVAKLIDNIPEL